MFVFNSNFNYWHISIIISWCISLFNFGTFRPPWGKVWVKFILKLTVVLDCVVYKDIQHSSLPPWWCQPGQTKEAKTPQKTVWTTVQPVAASNDSTDGNCVLLQGVQSCEHCVSVAPERSCTLAGWVSGRHKELLLYFTLHKRRN